MKSGTTHATKDGLKKGEAITSEGLAKESSTPEPRQRSQKRRIKYSGSSLSSLIMPLLTSTSKNYSLIDVGCLTVLSMLGYAVWTYVFPEGYIPSGVDDSAHYFKVWFFSTHGTNTGLFHDGVISGTWAIPYSSFTALSHIIQHSPSMYYSTSPPPSPIRSSIFYATYSL